MRRMLLLTIVTCGVLPAAGCQSCLDCFNRIEAWKCQTFQSCFNRNPCPPQACDPCAGYAGAGYPAGTVLGDNWGGWQDQGACCQDQCANPCGDACGNGCQTGCGSTVGVGAPSGECCNGNGGVSTMPMQSVPLQGVPMQGVPTINGGVTTPGLSPGPMTYEPSR